jgi:hypothetical protein
MLGLEAVAAQALDQGLGNSGVILHHEYSHTGIVARLRHQHAKDARGASVPYPRLTLPWVAIVHGLRTVASTLTSCQEAGS